MITKGTVVQLIKNKTYKDHPEKDEDVGIGETKTWGKYQQFQVLDKTPNKLGRLDGGFLYIQIYTDIPLKPKDCVTIKDILYITSKRRMSAIFGCTIEEGKAGEITFENEEGESEFGF